MVSQARLTRVWSPGCRRVIASRPAAQWPSWWSGQVGLVGTWHASLPAVAGMPGHAAPDGAINPAISSS
jgi:hypothetical protein